MATKAADHFNPSWKKWLRAANSAEAATWDRIRDLALCTTDTEQKQLLYSALAARMNARDANRFVPQIFA